LTNLSNEIQYTTVKFKYARNFTSPMDNQIFDKAKEFIEDLDIIIDLYDMSICWMSDKGKEIMSVPTSDMIGQTAYDFMASPMEDAQLQNKKDIMNSEGENEYPVNTKEGPLLLKFKYKTFKLNSGYYYVGKYLSSRPCGKESLINLDY